MHASPRDCSSYWSDLLANQPLTEPRCLHSHSGRARPSASPLLKRAHSERNDSPPSARGELHRRDRATNDDDIRGCQTGWHTQEHRRDRCAYSRAESAADLLHPSLEHSRETAPPLLMRAQSERIGSPRSTRTEVKLHSRGKAKTVCEGQKRWYSQEHRGEAYCNSKVRSASDNRNSGSAFFPRKWVPLSREVVRVPRQSLSKSMRDPRPAVPNVASNNRCEWMGGWQLDDPSNSIMRENFCVSNLHDDMWELQSQCYNLRLSSLGTRRQMCDRIDSHRQGLDRSPIEMRGHGHAW